MKKFKEKFNSSCLKIFTLIDLLYKDIAYYKDVIQIFSDEIGLEENNKTNVVLNKYLNALKIFGIKVEKNKNKFTIQESKFSENFDIDAIKSYNMLEKFIEIVPKGINKTYLIDFLKAIELRFSENNKNLLQAIRSTNNIDFSFYYTNFREQIDKCQQICQQNFKINIKYLENGVQQNALANPKEIIYNNKTAYLRVFKLSESQLLDISIPDIISIEQLPTGKTTFDRSTHVTFRLKGRLAKSYQPKEGEYVQTYEEDGSIVITNEIEPLNLLLKRLIRYDFSCEILAPKSARFKMIEMINDTLKNYE